MKLRNCCTEEVGFEPTILDLETNILPLKLFFLSKIKSLKMNNFNKYRLRDICNQTFK